MGRVSPIPTNARKDDAQALTNVRKEVFRLRQLSRMWADTVSAGQRGEFAALFAGRVLEALGAALHPKLELSVPSRQPVGQLDHGADVLAETLGKDASRLPIREALHLVTSVYPSLMAPDRRSSLGAFYTPPSLVETLLDSSESEGIDWLNARVLDPAAGGGAFMIEVAWRMRYAMKHMPASLVLSQIQSRLFGLEIDAHASSIAQRALEILLGDLLVATGRELPEMVRVCDALEEAPWARFDLVVGNPPYGRIALTDEQRMRFAKSLYGHANLYGVFTDIALRWTKAGGLVAFLTPTSFLAGRYFSSLRVLLAEDAPPVSLGIVHARSKVFEDVQQETMLAVYKRGAAPQNVRIYYVDVVNHRSAVVEKNGFVSLPVNKSHPWIAPRLPTQSELVKSAEKKESRLADWGYEVSTGPLVWNRHKTKLTHSASVRGARPLIWAESVTSAGRFVFQANKRNHAPYFVPEAGDDWMIVRRPCVLVQRTTAKEQSRRLIAAELSDEFIRLSDGVVVENHLNMIRPNDQPRAPPSVLSALLNSAVVDEVFRCISGSVAVSAFELEQLPLPAVNEIGALSVLVEGGATKREIDVECARLYGVHA